MKDRPRTRRKRKFERQFGPPGYVEWMQQQNCIVCGRTPCEVAHVRSRGAGGGWENNTVPMCTVCHRQQHDCGIQTFQRRHSVDMAERAREYTTRWQERGGYDIGF